MHLYFWIPTLIFIGFALNFTRLFISNWHLTGQKNIYLFLTLPPAYIFLLLLFVTDMSGDSLELFLIIFIVIISIWFSSFKNIILPQISTFLLWSSSFTLSLSLLYLPFPDLKPFLYFLIVLNLVYLFFLHIQSSVLKKYCGFLLFNILFSLIYISSVIATIIAILSGNQFLDTESGLAIIFASSYFVVPLLYFSYQIVLARSKNESISEFIQRTKIEEHFIDDHFFFSRRLSLSEILFLLISLPLQILLITTFHFSPLFVLSFYSLLAEWANDLFINHKRHILQKFLNIDGYFSRQAVFAVENFLREDIFSETEIINFLYSLQKVYQQHGHQINQTAVDKIIQAYKLKDN